MWRQRFSRLGRTPPANPMLIPVGLLLGLAIVGCQEKSDESQLGKPPMTIKVSSSAFKDGESIPKKYTADGANVSPPLRWSESPPGTKCFALICEDPDAPRGTWTHWVLYNIPALKNELPEGEPAREVLPDGADQGKNDFDKIGYGGPSPPQGKAHRYFFKLFALDTTVNLGAGPTRNQLLGAMKGHVLAEGQVMGTYQR
jgi:Raf kinase inhibitor-like YbhB/YbcL family protein